MKKQKGLQILRIPKDLSTTENRFYTAMPKILENRFDHVRWEEMITFINNIMENEDTWKYINILRYVIPFLGLIPVKDYKYKIRAYLKQCNKELATAGVKIMDPSEHSYTELEIIVYLE
ncbi:hypothetical protein NUSPORA_00151 [Nucleospora cyclopteri]